jgi:hypothetical protein
MSRPGIISAAMMAMTMVTINQGCTSQNFRVFTLVASEGSGLAIRPSICMKAGVGALSVCLTDGFGCFRTSPSELAMEPAKVSKIRADYCELSPAFSRISANHPHA